MATTSLSVMRQSLSENIGDYVSLDTTAAGDATGFSIVSTAFLNLSGGGDTDAFEGMYLLIADSDSSADGQSRVIAAYNADLDNPTCRVDRAFSVQIASGITVELHRYDPADKNNVLRQAIRELFPDLYLPVRDETLIVDNVLSNSDFETFSSGFTGWTEVGSPTVTQETSRVFHGDSSAKVVAVAGAAGQLTQSPSVNQAELAGVTTTAKFWGWASAASKARVRIDFGSETKDGDYHEGDSEWEQLSASQTVPTDATKVEVILEAAAGATVYWDLGYLTVGPKHVYTLPTSIIRGPHRITQQYNVDDVDGPYYDIGEGGAPTEGRILRVEGMGLLSRPSTNSGTTEVGEPQVSLVVAYAEMLLWRLMASPARAAKQDRQGYVDAGRDAAGKVAVLKAQKGLMMPRIGAQRHRNNWHVEADGSGRYIVFDRTRAGVLST